MSTISTDQAEELIDGGTKFLDVRTVEEFSDSHVPSAFNVPISTSGGGGMVANEDFVKVVEANFKKDEKLIVACKAGARSARACEMLRAAGFTSLLDMTAGFVGKKDAFGQVIPGWQAEGREVEVEADGTHTYSGLRQKLGE